MLKLLHISEIKGSIHTSCWPTKSEKKVTWPIYRPDERKAKKSNGTLELKFP